MDDISTVPGTRKSLKHKIDPETAARPHPENIIRLVVNIKKTVTGNSVSHDALIKLTRKLAKDAESGDLKGLGVFAEYEEDSYTLGLEGSYLTHPEKAVLPLMRLQRRVMNKVEEED